MSPRHEIDQEQDPNWRSAPRAAHIDNPEYDYSAPTRLQIVGPLKAVVDNMTQQYTPDYDIGAGPLACKFMMTAHGARRENEEEMFARYLSDPECLAALMESIGTRPVCSQCRQGGHYSQMICMSHMAAYKRALYPIEATVRCMLSGSHPVYAMG